MSPAGRPEPLRIAAHNGAPVWGGAEIATARLLAGLQERGHEVVLYCNRTVVAEGAAAFGLDVRRAYLGGDIAIHHALRFGLTLRSLDPHVLIVGTFRKLWLAALAARIAGVPAVARIGLSTDVPRNAKYRLTFRRLVDRVITNAHDLADAYRRALPDAPPPEIRAVPKGIRLPGPGRPRAETRSGLGVSTDALLIGGVGRLVEQKRFDRLLEAFARLAPDPGPPGPQAGGGGTAAPGRGEPALVIVGGGPLRASLEALAGRLGVADRVRFAGHRDDIPDVLAALDLLVVSSDRESMANVMLEAMAAGLPVVSTPVSGAAEALGADRDALAGGGGEAEAGVIVEPEPAALAAGIERLTADPERLRAMGAAARRRCEARFGRARMLDEWESELRAAARPLGAGAAR